MNKTFYIKLVRCVYVQRKSAKHACTGAAKGKETVNVKQTYFNNQGQEITTINNTFPILKTVSFKERLKLLKT